MSDHFVEYEYEVEPECDICYLPIDTSNAIEDDGKWFHYDCYGEPEEVDENNYCYTCGKVIAEGEEFFDEVNIYCSDCAKVCVSCNEIIWDWTENSYGDCYCDFCYNDAWFACDNCGDEVSIDEKSYHNGNVYCDTCIVDVEKESNIKQFENDSDVNEQNADVFFSVMLELSSSEFDFTNVVFEEMFVFPDFKGCTFYNCTFSHSYFTFVTFDKCSFDQCNFVNCTFTNCRVKDSDFLNCEVKNCTNHNIDIQNSPTCEW